jgi:hypothetical protein
MVPAGAAGASAATSYDSDHTLPHGEAGAAFGEVGNGAALTPAAAGAGTPATSARAPGRAPAAITDAAPAAPEAAAFPARASLPELAARPDDRRAGLFSPAGEAARGPGALDDIRRDLTRAYAEAAAAGDVAGRLLALGLLARVNAHAAARGKGATCTTI